MFCVPISKCFDRFSPDLACFQSFFDPVFTRFLPFCTQYHCFLTVFHPFGPRNRENSEKVVVGGEVVGTGHPVYHGCRVNKGHYTLAPAPAPSRVRLQSWLHAVHCCRTRPGSCSPGFFRLVAERVVDELIADPQKRCLQTSDSEKTLVQRYWLFASMLSTQKHVFSTVFSAFLLHFPDCVLVLALVYTMG